MKRQTNSKSSKVGLAAALVAAVAFVASACGGMEPMTDQSDQNAALDEPMTAEVELDADRSYTNVATVDAPKQDLAHAAEANPGASIRSSETPRYLKEQVLELCGDATMKTRSEMADEELKRDFTLEMWVRIKSAGDQPIVQAQGMEIAIRHDRVVASLGGTEVEGLEVVEDEWYHVALVVWQDKLNLFVNGIPAGPAELEQEERPRGSLTFGGNNESGESFCGRLDNVRLTGEALYATSFMASQELKKLDSAVFTYDFDDQLGKSVADKGYWGNDAKLSDDAWMVPGQI